MVPVATGTLWANTENTPIQRVADLDNTRLGVAQLGSNQTGEHCTVPTLLLRLNLTFGQHPLALLLSGTGVVSDLNDSDSAALVFSSPSVLPA